MKIGIIGSGNMGRAIGTRFAQSGHDVFFGARDEEKSREAASLAKSGTHSGSIDAAARFGDVLLWTIREPQPSKVLADASLLNGKIVIDLNNRDYAKEARTGAWFGQAIAEQLQQNAPGAQVVKAFNTVAMETFDTPPEALRSIGAQIFLAGKDEGAKERVGALVRDLGFESIDVGSDAAAFRAVEALGDVVRLLMIDGKRGGRAHLKLVTLPEPTLHAIGKREDSSYA